MYAVEIHHLRPCYINGDLDSERIIENVKYFGTLKEAKAFIERSVRGKLGNFIKKTRSECYGMYYTNKTWVEENTGEERNESFYFECKKR